MANRRFQRAQNLEKEVKSLFLTIVTDGSGDVSSIDGLGVESVSHSANEYTITLEDKFTSLRHVSAISGVQATFALTSSDVNSGKTIVIEASALQASTEVSVRLDLKNTDVK